MHMKCVSSTVERSAKCVAENAQCYTRASFSQRRIGANQRIGNSLDFRCRRNTSLLFLHGVARWVDASQPARRFSRINEPRANYSPPWKLSWKYWKVRGVEWLLPVSGATILLCTGYRAQRRFLTNGKYKWKKRKRKNKMFQTSIRVTGKNEDRERENGTNDRVSSDGFVELPEINHIVREILMDRWTVLLLSIHILVQSYFY